MFLVKNPLDKNHAKIREEKPIIHSCTYMKGRSPKTGITGLFTRLLRKNPAICFMNWVYAANYSNFGGFHDMTLSCRECIN